MFRKYVIITLAAVFFLGAASCTSKKAADENADVEASLQDESLEVAEASENNDDLSTDEGNEKVESGDTAVADLGGDELAPEEKLTDEGGEQLAENSEVTTDDLSEAPVEKTEQLAENSEVPPESATPEAQESLDASPTATETAAVEPAPISEEPAAPPVSSTPEPEYESPKPVTLSLKKVASQPWKVGKILANSVYIVRNGDTIEGISGKIFGSPDKVKDICKVNSYNCNRGIKVGDKLYYNSPQRPTDDAVVKTFYEDAGETPQIYTAKSGDNIRVLGKELLGHDRSWMELWATNEVESKGDLEEGTQLKYWPATEVAAPTQTLAATESVTTPPAEVSSEAQPTQEEGFAPQDMTAAPPLVEDMAAAPVEDTSVPPPSDQAMNDLPPPPDQAAAGSMEPPPPPPPPPPIPVDNQASMDAGGQDPNQTMILGVGAILLLAAAALIVSIRKKRQRRAIDFNTTTQTQID